MKYVMAKYISFKPDMDREFVNVRDIYGILPSTIRVLRSRGYRIVPYIGGNTISLSSKSRAIIWDTSHTIDGNRAIPIAIYADKRRAETDKYGLHDGTDMPAVLGFKTCAVTYEYETPELKPEDD